MKDKANIAEQREYLVDAGSAPMDLGEFKELEDAKAFLEENLFSVQSHQVATRKMLEAERMDLRDTYNDLIEVELQKRRERYARALRDLERAKSAAKLAGELVGETLAEVYSLVEELKRGTKQETLDPESTFRVPFDGHHCYYTYADGRLRLAHRHQFDPDDQKELFDHIDENEQFLVKNFDVVFKEMEATEGG